MSNLPFTVKVLSIALAAQGTRAANLNADAAFDFHFDDHFDGHEPYKPIDVEVSTPKNLSHDHGIGHYDTLEFKAYVPGGKAKGYSLSEYNRYTGSPRPMKDFSNVLRSDIPNFGRFLAKYDESSESETTDEIKKKVSWVRISRILDLIFIIVLLEKTTGGKPTSSTTTTF